MTCAVNCACVIGRILFALRLLFTESTTRHYYLYPIHCSSHQSALEQAAALQEFNTPAEPFQTLWKKCFAWPGSERGCLQVPRNARCYGCLQCNRTSHVTIVREPFRMSNELRRVTRKKRTYLTCIDESANKVYGNGFHHRCVEIV